MEKKFFRNLDLSCSALAERIAELSRESIEQKRSFSLVLSGGKTPLPLYNLLGTEYRKKIQWKRVHLFWSDERWVPFNHPESNFGMALKTFISKVNIPEINVHPMPVYEKTPEWGAAVYEQQLKEYFHEAEFGRHGFTFDVVLLGLGEDGHTASLFPGHPALLEKKKWVLPVEAPAEYPTTSRLTLTFPVINASKNVVFLVSGKNKKKIVLPILNSENGLQKENPVEWIKPKGRLTWFLDPEY